MSRQDAAAPNATPSRRDFLRAGAAAAIAAPMIHTTTKGQTAPILGGGAYAYEPDHHFGKLPDTIKWGETHGVAIDADGFIYVKHRSDNPEPLDAIVVFDPEGKYVRSFGKEYHGGGHGIDIRKEGGQEFLYLSDIRHGVVVKTDLKGEHVWSKGRPKEPGVYDDPKAPWIPTNVCFAPDGGFYIADGYGSNYIHKYDKDAKWIRTFGGTGDESGKFKTPHGLWLDDRPGRDTLLVVADRANARLQYLTLDGKPVSMNKDVSFPAHFDIQRDVLLCPDLHARVTLFDKDNKVIHHLGYHPDWTKQVLDGFKMRGQPERWEAGRFIHPHDACFDKDGNIFVVEWVATGRVSKLKKLG